MQIGAEEISEALYLRVNTMMFPFPEAFSGSVYEYAQLQYLVNKHYIRAILLVFIKFILEVTFRDTFIKIFKLCGLDISWKINEDETFYGGDIPHDAKNLLYPPFKYRPEDRNNVPLLGLDDQVLIEYVARQATKDPQFAARLQTAFDEASRPPMELPTVAPKLWADNTEGLPATAFVAKYYAPWIEAGVLTLKAIGQCDPALSKAYSNRAHRNPSEALPLAKAEHPRFIADPQEAAERYRENARRGNARYRAKRGALTHD